MNRVGPDGDPWGLPAATAWDLVDALSHVPEGATLWKIHVTGNLGVIVEDELVAVIDLATGEYVER